MKILICYFSIVSSLVFAQEPMKYAVSMENPASLTFHVSLNYKPEKSDSLVLKMPDWTPGYYQLMDYAANVSDLKAKDQNGNAIEWKRSGKTGWVIYNKSTSSLTIDYNVKATRKFVATSYLDSAHAYITPASMFLYLDQKIKTPAEVTINPYKDWKNIATGLDSISKQKHTYYAPDFDILYDSPFLI